MLWRAYPTRKHPSFNWIVFNSTAKHFVTDIVFLAPAYTHFTKDLPDEETMTNEMRSHGLLKIEDGVAIIEK